MLWLGSGYGLKMALLMPSSMVAQILSLAPLALQEQQGQDGSLHLSGNHIWGHSQALW